MVLGVTGGVASGKSAFVAALMEIAQPGGAVAFSADDMARDLLAPGSPMTKSVLDHFGAAFRTGGDADSIDRAKLARRIFSSPIDRNWLEGLMHPVILEGLSRETMPYRGRPALSPESSDYCLAIAEIPLLYEIGAEGTVDAVVVTVCREQTQLARLKARRPHMTDADAYLQIRSQMPLGDKAARGGYVIDAEGSLTDLKRHARTLLDRLTGAGGV